MSAHETTQEPVLTATADTELETYKEMTRNMGGTIQVTDAPAEAAGSSETGSPSGPGIQVILAAAAVVLLLAVILVALKLRKQSSRQRPVLKMEKQPSGGTGADAISASKLEQTVQDEKTTRKSDAEQEAFVGDSKVLNSQGMESGIRAGNCLTLSYAQEMGTGLQDETLLYAFQEEQNAEGQFLLAAISEGIGKLELGAAAGMAALQAMQSALSPDLLVLSPSDMLLELTAAAHKGASAGMKNQETGAGATLAGVLVENDRFWFISVGDSRIYLYRAGVLLQMNREHMMGRVKAEMQAVTGKMEGEPFEPEAITSFLGMNNLTQIDRTIDGTVLLPGDHLLLVSKAAAELLGEAEIAGILGDGKEEAAEAVLHALHRKTGTGQINATVVQIAYD